MEQDQKTYALVAAAKQGDNNAFTELYNSAYQMVYHTCYGYLKNREDAEDVTQEVFIYIYNKLSELEDNYAFYGWVKVIAIHSCLNKIKAKRDNISYDDAIGSEEILEGDDNVEMLPDTYVLRDEKRKIVMEIMEKELSEVQYQTLFMYYYNDFKIEQIAQIMEVSEGTVKTRLKSAKIKVKQGIEDYENKTGDRLAVNGAIPSIAMVLKNVTNSIPVPFLTFAGVGGFGVAGSLVASGIAKAANLIVNLGSSASAIIPQGAGAIGMGAGANGQIPGGNTQMPTVPKSVPHNPVAQSSGAQAQAPGKAPGKVPGAQPQTPNQMPSAQAQAPVTQVPNAQTPVTQPQTPSAPIEPNAKPNAQSVQNLQNNARNAATSVAQKTSKGVATKIVAGVAATAILGTGTFAVVKLINNKKDDSVDERTTKKVEETEIDNESEPVVIETEPYIIETEAYDPFNGQQFEVGGKVTFGNYEGEDISWLVLDEKDGNYLVLSEYGLKAGLFDERDPEYENVQFCWENVSCRTWLNNDFYNDAFDADIQDRIVLTTVTADSNPEFGTYQGTDTQDRVFLFSINEVNQYLGDNVACYATQNVINTADYPENFSDGNCLWWLRTMGEDSAKLTYVNPSYVEWGMAPCDTWGAPPYDQQGKSIAGCFRPAMWVRPNSVDLTTEILPLETSVSSDITEMTCAIMPCYPLDYSIDYDVCDFLYIDYREIIISNSGGLTLVAPVPQLILANNEDQNDVNNLLCNECTKMDVLLVGDNIIAVSICNNYTGSDKVTQYIINLDTSEVLSVSMIDDSDSVRGAGARYDIGYMWGFEYTFIEDSDRNIGISEFITAPMWFMFEE